MLGMRRGEQGLTHPALPTFPPDILQQSKSSGLGQLSDPRGQGSKCGFQDAPGYDLAQEQLRPYWPGNTEELTQVLHLPRRTFYRTVWNQDLKHQPFWVCPAFDTAI